MDTVPRIETAPELLARRLPAPRIIVDGLLGEGVTVLVAPAKAGKTWMALAAARAIATGRPWMGSEVEQGDVIYLDKQNGEAVLQDRMRQLLDGDNTPLDRLHFAYDWPRFGADESGLERLGSALDANRTISTVVVDMLVDMRPLRKGQQDKDVYQSDYVLLAHLNRFALKRHTALLILHHANKRPFDRDNPMLSVSGSMGIAGGASASWVLHRPFGGDEGMLYVSSRQFDSRAVPLTWRDLFSAWVPTEAGDGDPAEIAARASEKRLTARSAVLHAFAGAGMARLSIRQLVDATGLDIKQVRNAAARLVDDKRLERLDYGLYQPPSINADILPQVSDYASRSLSGDGGAIHPEINRNDDMRAASDERKRLACARAHFLTAGERLTYAALTTRDGAILAGEQNYRKYAQTMPADALEEAAGRAEAAAAALGIPLLEGSNP